MTKLDERSAELLIVPEVAIEEDVPMYVTPERGAIEKPKKDVKELEKQVTLLNQLQIFQLKDKAYNLIISSIIILVLLYAADVILINAGLKNSDLLSGIFEFLKFVVSTLFGFVFSRYLSEKE